MYSEQIYCLTYSNYVHLHNHPITALFSAVICLMISLNIVIIHWFRLPDTTDQPHVLLP